MKSRQGLKKIAPRFSAELPRVVTEAVSPEHRHEFLSKRSSAMMLGLIPNIRDRCIKAGNGDAECAISFLPFEWMQLGKCLVNPLGRIAFEKLQGLKYRKGCRERNQYVHRIHGASDREPLSFYFLSRYRRDMAKGARANLN
jgi:hypothetical protein